MTTESSLSKIAKQRWPLPDAWTGLSKGNLGDIVSVGGGVSERRVFVGQGYRLYFTIREGELIILLCGGDKSSQQRDIQKAKELAKNL